MSYIEAILILNATVVMISTTLIIGIVYKIGKEVYRHAIQRD